MTLPQIHQAFQDPHQCPELECLKDPGMRRIEIEALLSAVGSVVSTMLEQRQSNFVADAQRQYDNGVISKQTLHEIQRTYR